MFGKKFLLIFTAALAFAAQDTKKILDHDAYDIWTSVKNRTIAPTGAWVAYTAAPDEKDGYLEIISKEGQSAGTFLRGDSLTFSSDGSWAVFLQRPAVKETAAAKKKKSSTMPADSLIVLKCSESEIKFKNEVKTYALPEDNSETIAWLIPAEKDTSIADSLKQPASTDMVLFRTASADTVQIPRVTDMLFSKDGSWLAYRTVTSDSLKDALMLRHLSEGTELPLRTGYSEKGVMAFDEDSRFLAFVEGRKDTAEGYIRFSLSIHDLKSGKTVQNISDSDLPSGMHISSGKDPVFSKNGKSLFFPVSTYVQDSEYLESKEDSMATEINVQIWHWKDPYLMTMQTVDVKKELKRTYDMRLDIKKGGIVPMSRPEIPEVIYDEDREAPFALGMSNLPYRQRISWDTPEYYDCYAIDMRTGEAERILTEVQYNVKISPGGEFIVWWDRGDSTWYAMDLKKKKIRDLGAGIDADLWNHEHDWAFLPDPAAEPEWDRNDRFIFIHDNYDIWKVDAGKPEHAENITVTGRSEGVRYRIQNIDPEERAVDIDKGLLLSAFSPSSKKSGFARVDSKSKSAESLIFMDKRFSKPLKARDADILLFSREDISEFPDLRITADEFRTDKQLTALNPFQKEYNWAQAELIEWISLDGLPLQGILYKPENFSEDSLYPLIVYFYERNSDNLHRHSYPRALSSIINFTFYASRGYCIFVPDIPYRVGHPGESAYSAVMSGVTLLAEKPWIDGDNMAIEGHSWGGYQVAWLVTQTDRFKAASGGAPVSNMTSAYGGIRWETGLSRMFQYEKTQSRIGATLWESPQLYIENSPLFFADRIRTPLLIMHNDRDGHVPWTQGIELFVAMRRLGKPAWLVNYSGEPHWPTTFDKRKDWAIRMQQYFDHFLKGAEAAPWIRDGIPAVEAKNTLGY